MTLCRISLENLNGTWTALATPFSRDGSSVDEESLERLVKRQIRAGVAGIVACGSTGEAQTLTDKEYRQVIRRTCEYLGGRLPLMAGVGSSSTARACELAQAAVTDGANGILLVTPPYNKPMQQGIIEHFHAVRAAVSVPIIAYNIPSRAAINIEAVTLIKMVEEGLIIGIKDSTSSLDQMMEVVEALGERVAILSGEDGLVHPIMACGGRGVISASANVVPQQFVALTKAALEGEWETSRRLQLNLLPIVRALFMETNPIPAKAALAIQGVIACDAVRLPLTKATELTSNKLRSLLETNSG